MSRGKGALVAQVADVNRGVRKSMALDLRVKGYSQAEIAKQLGVTQPTVSRYIQAALNERQEMSVNAWRRLEEARIEAIERSMWQALGRGNTQAALVLTRLLDRRAKLYGLDMPPAIADSTPQIIIGLSEQLHAAIMGTPATSRSAIPEMQPEFAAALAAEQRYASEHVGEREPTARTGDDGL